MPKEMDVSKAMLLDSDDKTYRVYHPQRGEMRIARASVDDNTRKFIDGLPKFSDGAGPDDLQEEAAKQEAYPVYSADQDLAMQSTNTAIENKPIAEDMAKGLALGNESASTIPAPAVIQPPQSTTTTQQRKTPSELYAESNKLELESIEKQKQAALDLSKSTVTAIQSQNNIEALVKSKYGEERERLLKEANQLRHDLATNKIDPNRYWGTKHSLGSWMARMGAAISVGISGFGSALLKQPGNTALEMIMKQIDQDIEAQKEEMKQKRNALSDNLDRLGSLDKAEALLRAQKIASAQNMLEIAKAQASGQVAEVNAAKMKADLDIKMAEQYDKLAAQNTIDQLTGRQVPGQQPQQVDISKLSKEQRETLVKLPDNSFGLALDKDAAVKARATGIAVSQLRDLRNEYEDLMKNGTTWGLTKRRAKEDALRSRGTLLIKNVEGLGALSGQDFKLTEGVLPDPSNLFQGQEQQKLASMDDYIRSKEGELTKLVPNYKVTPTEKDRQKEMEMDWLKKNLGNSSKQDKVDFLIKKYGLKNATR